MKQTKIHYGECLICGDHSTGDMIDIEDIDEELAVLVKRALPDVDSIPFCSHHMMLHKPGNMKGSK